MRCTLALAISLLLLGKTFAAEVKPARVTQVIHEVNLGEANATPRAAAVNDNVPEGTAVGTGIDSRAELTFGDNTVTRLGAKSVFHFKKGARILELNDGVMLVDVPKSAWGAILRGGGVAASIRGTTSVFEFHAGSFKFLVLQGEARLYRPGHVGDSVVVSAGRMVFGNPSAALSDPVDFDVRRFVTTCRLINDFAPLRSAALLAKRSDNQEREKSKKRLIETNLVIFGEGTLVSLIDPAKEKASATTGDSTNGQPTPLATPIGVQPPIDKMINRPP